MHGDNKSNLFRILYLDVTISDQIGGGQYFGARLMKQLSSKFNLKIISNHDMFYSQFQNSNCEVIPQSKGMKVLTKILYGIYKLNNRKLILFTGFLPFILYLGYCSRIIKKLENNFDLILTGDDYYQGEIAVLLAKLKRYPTVHILNSSEPLDLGGIKGSRFMFTILLRFFDNLNDLFFIALNNATALDFEKLFPGKTRTIPIGIDTDEYMPVDFDNKKNAIIYLGRLDEGQKNISLLIKAFALLKNEKYSLLIAGSGRDYYKYSDMISDLNLAGKCHMIGSISNNEKKKLLAESKIFVSPSIREGQSNAVIEAMSSGIAIVCVRNEGSNETINDGYDGILVDNNETKLKDVLEYLISNDERIKELSTNARKSAVQKYSIVAVAEQYENVFASLLCAENEKN